MKAKHYVSVYLPPGLAAAAAQEAARRGIPVARLLRLALEAELDRAQRRPDPGTVQAAMGDLVPDPITDLAVVAE